MQALSLFYRRSPVTIPVYSDFQRTVLVNITLYIFWGVIGLIILNWNDINEVAVTDPYFVQLTRNGIAEEDVSDLYGHFVSKRIQYFQGPYVKAVR